MRQFTTALLGIPRRPRSTTLIRAAWLWSARASRAAKREGQDKRFRGLARLGGGAPPILATSSLRLSVFLQWVWTYVTGLRGDRLIVSQHGSEVTKPGSDTPVKVTLAARQNSAPGRTEGVKTPTGGAIALKEAV
jgi:hypothetical protein